MPDDKDSSSHSGVGDGDVEVEVEVEVEVDTREEEEEEDSDDFFDAGEGAVVGDRSSRAASESSQSGGGTEDDPVGPTTPSATAAPTTNPISHKTTTAVVGFSRMISTDSVDLDDDDEEWVDPTPIPATPLEPVPTVFPPPIIAKTKSSSSAKSSRKRKEARAANVPFPSSVTEGEDCPPRSVPQMSTARGRDGGRTQSGGVKGVIAPDAGPAELDDPGDDF